MQTEWPKFLVRRPVYLKRYEFLVVAALSAEDALLRCQDNDIWQPAFKYSDERMTTGLPEVVEEISSVKEKENHE